MHLRNSSFVRRIRNRCMWNIAPSNMYWSEAGSVRHPNVFLYPNFCSLYSWSVWYFLLSLFETSPWMILPRDLLDGGCAQKRSLYCMWDQLFYILIWDSEPIFTIQIANFLLYKKTRMSTILHQLLLWYSNSFLHGVSSTTGISISNSSYEMI